MVPIEPWRNSTLFFGAVALCTTKIDHLKTTCPCRSHIQHLHYSAFAAFFPYMLPTPLCGTFRSWRDLHKRVMSSGCHECMIVPGAWVSWEHECYGSMAVTGAWNQCFWLAKAPVLASQSENACIFILLAFYHMAKQQSRSRAEILAWASTLQ